MVKSVMFIKILVTLVISNHDKPRSHKIRLFTCRCLCSSRNFSTFALSYSPFSKHLWSGLSLESVGGSFSCKRYKFISIINQSNPKNKREAYSKFYQIWHLRIRRYSTDQFADKILRLQHV